MTIRPLLAVALALAFGAIVPAAIAAQVSITIEPKKMHEECQRLEAGDKRTWHWKSSSAVDFNIHFHRDKEVVFPVKRAAMRGDGGSFTAKTGEDYCWMWTARNAPAKLEAHIK